MGAHQYRRRDACGAAERPEHEQHHGQEAGESRGQKRQGMRLDGKRDGQRVGIEAPQAGRA